MALQQCHECGHDVSSEAKACPRCGAAIQKKAGPVAWAIGLLILAGIISSTLNGMSRNSKAPATPEQTAEQKAQAARISATAGLMKLTRERLHDPSSVIWELALASDDATTICIQYRAKNAFGAYVRNTVTLGGKKISTDPAAWNRYCAGKELYDTMMAVER